ncbi:hypothetical protein Q3G72_019828 [Acer saccharum]|nr:hypothetical protein Q3G72_019828 [Acer saccharum]
MEARSTRDQTCHPHFCNPHFCGYVEVAITNSSTIQRKHKRISSFILIFYFSYKFKNAADFDCVREESHRSPGPRFL